MTQAPQNIAVTVMVFTLDEQIHLPACLSSLHWCDDIVIVDSFSNDRTEEIAREFGARFFQRRFDDLAKQRNWALEQVPRDNDWVLILDADERVSAALRHEISARLATIGPEVAAFRLKRRFHMWGRWLPRSSLYPSWLVRLVHGVVVGETQTLHGEGAEVGAAGGAEGRGGAVGDVLRRVEVAVGEGP